MHSTRLLVLVAVAACGGTPARSTTTPPTPPPTPPPVAAAPAITRIAAGETPGSNTHRWGTRYFELRARAGVIEIRLHDVVSFQGVGMRPEDMGADQHACTAWEPLPSTIPDIPAGTRACSAVVAACDAIRSWYGTSAPAPATPAPTEATAFDAHYGRASAACD